jgi:hypothetical protein
MRMSKRSFAILAVALLSAAACDNAPLIEAPKEQRKQDRSAPVTAPEMRVDPVATAEPGFDRTQWRASSELARSLGGNMSASLERGRGGPLVLAFADGITLRLERVGDHQGADRTGLGSSTFASSLSTDPNAGVYVYRVLDEKLASSARQGGLCLKEGTTHVAISEFVNRAGEWVLALASFKGQTPPGPQADVDPNLCGAFGYEVN